MRISFLIGSLALAQSITISAWAASACLVDRAAFDIGSGGVRLKVAQVDKCQNKITKVLFRNETRVDFAEDLSKSSEKKFSDELLAKAEGEFTKLMTTAQKLGALEIAGSATAAFREAQNAPALIEKINKKFNAHLRIISQDEEAELAFFATAGKSGKAATQIAVWDIGGKSMQLSFLESFLEVKSLNLNSFKDQMGAVTFKKVLISEIQKKDAQTINTPNPLSREDWAGATRWAEKNSKEKISSELEALLKTKEIVGVGGVLSKSLAMTLGKDEFNQNDISKRFEKFKRDASSKKLDLTDDYVQKMFPETQYADTDISNMAMVLGYMKGLNIKKLKTLKIDLSDGVLLQSKFYQ